MKFAADIFRLISFLLRCSKDIKRSRVTILTMIVVGVAGGLSVTALIAIINNALARIGSQTTLIIWGFALLCVISPTTTYASQMLLIRLTARAVFVLRMQLCKRILSVPLRHLEELGGHRLMAALTEDIPAITGALTSLPLLCVNAAVVVGCLVYLGWISWPLLLGVLALMAFGIATFQVPMIRAMRYFRQAREESDALFRHYNALAEGAKELKLHRERREAFYGLLENTTTNLQRHSIRGNTIAAAAENWGEVLFFIFIGILLFAVPRFVQLEGSTLTSYVLTVLFMRTPLAQLLNVIPNLGRATISVQKVEALGLSLVSQPVEQDSAGKAESNGKWERLELCAATHAYHHEGEDKDFVVGPLDLVLYPGELVFIIGGNGSGKTTLAKILTGLYAPDSGEIRLDGKRVTIENRDEYRQYFSAIFSDSYIFEALLGFERATLDAEVREYLVKLELNHKVKVKDGALSTINLSQGQRKRLALLTAYIEDRPIYLFDEWAADQDPMFKELFYYTLLPELKARGKTVLVISHDDRYYHKADRIIKLNYGKVEYDKHVTSSQPVLTGTSRMSG